MQITPRSVSDLRKLATSNLLKAGWHDAGKDIIVERETAHTDPLHKCRQDWLALLNAQPQPLRDALSRRDFDNAITIAIHLLDPGVDRSMAEFKEVSPGVVLDFNRDISGGGRDSDSVQAS